MPAPANAMVQQPDIFERVMALASVPMAPNEHGLFTIDQVAVLAAKRGCNLHRIDDCGCVARRGGKEITIVAHNKGLYHPVNIFRACREASGKPSYENDHAKTKVKNPGGLDEVRIASIIGADGVRPYLSRPGQYYANADGTRISAPSSRARWRPFGIEGTPKLEAGNWTWSMFCVMCAGGQPPPFWGAGRSYDYRRAVRALEASGLIKLTPGPRGSFETATYEWLPLAFLTPPTTKLDPADAQALAEMGYADLGV